MRPAVLLVNGLTLLNAIGGVAAMAVLALGRVAGWSGPHTLLVAALCIMGAYVPDILDGVAARALHASSKVGAQLDVNADTTSFNLATALLVIVTPPFALETSPQDSPGLLALGLAAGLVYACCGLVRSARLVVTTTPESKVGRWFWGMTTNGSAMLTTALLLVALTQRTDRPELARILLLAVPLQAFVLGPLMVSRVCFPDVPQQLTKGVVARWPVLLCFALWPLTNAPIAWAVGVYWYVLVGPLVRAIRGGPLP